MLWNLCQSIVEPVATLQLHPEEKDAKTSVNTAALPANPSGVSTMSALNKTVWTADGKRLLIGDSRYALHLPRY
jgi:hypothetical protein